MVETWNGSAWVAPGDWVTYTPTWTAATTNPTLGSAALTGRYSLVGKTCTVKIELSTASNTNFGSGAYSWALPFMSSTAGTAQSVGAGHGLTASARWPLQPMITTDQTTFSILTPAGSGDTRLQFLGNGQGMGGVAWATSQTMRAQITYETA
jgi:hypothetical protein